MALTIAALWGLRLKPCIVLHSFGLWSVLWLSTLRLIFLVYTTFVIQSSISELVLLQELKKKKGKKKDLFNMILNMFKYSTLNKYEINVVVYMQYIITL